MAGRKSRARRGASGRTNVRVCVDKTLPFDRLIRAGESAIAARADNAPILRRQPGVATPPRLRMALEAKKLWENGRALRVAFTQGQPKVQAKVEQFARLWEPHANIRLDFGDHSDAEIRIAFDRVDGGSWSYIGTDNLLIPKNEHTMNFGWLTADTDDREYERVVVHEFGHALGCIHEHQNPTANIPWDREKVYAYYARQGWSRDDVDQNVFQRYSATQVNATEFDPQSIMLYAVPNEHTIGDFEIGWNTTLSARDKAFIASQYPKTAPVLPTVRLDGPLALAAIGKPGEVDRFEFTIAKAGRYEIETRGKTDVVLSVFGPAGQWLGEDDDSGLGRNARLSLSLAPGRYAATVRHYANGTGSYGVRLRTRT